MSVGQMLKYHHNLRKNKSPVVVVCCDLGCLNNDIWYPGTPYKCSHCGSEYLSEYQIKKSTNRIESFLKKDLSAYVHFKDFSIDTFQLHDCYLTLMNGDLDYEMSLWDIDAMCCWVDENDEQLEYCYAPEGIVINSVLLDESASFQCRLNQTDVQSICDLVNAMYRDVVDIKKLKWWTFLTPTVLQLIKNIGASRNIYFIED